MAQADGDTSSFYPDEEHLYDGLTSQQRADCLLAEHQKKREHLSKLHGHVLQLRQQVADAERKQEQS